MKRKTVVHPCENRLQAYCSLRFLHKMPAAKAWRDSADFAKVPRWFGDDPSGVRLPDCHGVRGGEPHKAGGEMMTWCEDTSYFRNVREAHEIIKLRHTGWYTDDEFQDEVMKGMVFQLPGRGGKPQFLAGRSDPCNEGTACIDMETIYNDEEEAARAADEIARITAEDEREYQAAYRLGSDAARARAESIEEVGTVRALVADLKAITVTGVPMAICSVIKQRIDEGMDRVKRLRRKAAELIEEHGSNEAFCNGLADG